MRRPKTTGRAVASAIPFVVLLAAACGGDGADPDAGGRADGAAASLEIGTGADRFVPIEDGETLGMVRGTQGLQHVFVSLRSRGLAPRGAIVELALVRGRDGEVVSNPFEVRLSLTPVEGEGYAELWGLLLVIEFPDEALGEALTLEASVVDSDGREATASKAVRVEWAP